MEAVPAHLFVLFGATGDLARKKLLPALQRLTARKVAQLAVLGVARDRTIDDGGFRELAGQALRDAGIAARDVEPFCRTLHYHGTGRGERAPEETFAALRERIDDVERGAGLGGHRVFYLAVPPSAFGGIVRGLGEARLDSAGGEVRLVLEKPIGRDLASAREVNRVVRRIFDEEQVFRIDHFLGKDTVQNLLVLRFANACFEAVWNRQHIDHVQITVAETIGIEQRAAYYDSAGALRDMVQNHLTQILTLVAMDVPLSYDADSLRDEKRRVLRAAVPPTAADVVRARYVAGSVGGERVPGYRDEQGVAADSATETFVALRLAIHNWRWQGVPFYLRTGKRLPRRLSEVAVVFRSPPVALLESFELGEVQQDVLRLTLQPDEGFSFELDVKRPGPPPSLAKVPLRFAYREAFGELPDAYTTLLRDVLAGDRTLFVGAEEAELAWRLYEPLLAEGGVVHEHRAGTWGPPAADELLARDGRAWNVLA